MTLSLTLENKNSISLTNEERVNNPTWDEATMTWDESNPETWDSQSTVFTRETKNNISLTLENKT